MTRVPPHEDKRVPLSFSFAFSLPDSRAGESAHVADGVAGGVEEVEAAVAEVIVGGEAAEG